MIHPPRRRDAVSASRDWQGCAVIIATVEGLDHVLHHSRDYTRDEWTALVEEITGTRGDREAREALRLSPAEARAPHDA